MLGKQNRDFWIRNSFLPRRIRNRYEKNFHAYMFNYNFPTIPYFRRNVDVLNRKRNLTITRYATLKLLRVNVTTILFQVLKRIIFDLVPETWFFWIFFFLFNELETFWNSKSLFIVFVTNRSPIRIIIVQIIERIIYLCN